MSAWPKFWQGAAVALGRRRGSTWIDLEELTEVLLSWLWEAVGWESNAEAIGIASSPSGSEGLPVHLHIYDVTREQSIQRINSILAHESSPLKLGGIFHAGVEVN